MQGLVYKNLNTSFKVSKVGIFSERAFLTNHISFDVVFMSYLPHRRPEHRSYSEKQALLCKWNELRHGGMTQKEFCRSRKIRISTFEKWVMNQDKIN
jgi:hypothetical protein